MMNFKNKKIIFLDFDGCMTSKQDDTYFPLDVSKYNYSKQILERLQKLCEVTGSKIIISSNWRKFDQDGFWMNPETHCKYYNPIFKLIDALGDLYLGMLPTKRHIKKFEALELWFEENNLKNTDVKYVIFDDDLKEDFQFSRFASNFIFVDNNFGISEYDVLKAENILK